MNTTEANRLSLFSTLPYKNNKVSIKLNGVIVMLLWYDTLSIKYENKPKTLWKHSTASWKSPFSAWVNPRDEYVEALFGIMASASKWYIMDSSYFLQRETSLYLTVHGDIKSEKFKNKFIDKMNHLSFLQTCPKLLKKGSHFSDFRFALMPLNFFIAFKKQSSAVWYLK